MNGHSRIAMYFSGRTAVALGCAFVGSAALAQLQALPGRPSVPELLIKWTPLLAPRG